MLRQEAARQQNARRELKTSWRNRDDLVCVRQDGRAIKPDVMSAEFHDLVAKLIENKQLPATKRVTFHSLRHSHATLLVFDGAHVKDISARLGHSTIGITMNLYAQALEESQVRIAKRLETSMGASFRKRSPPKNGAKMARKRSA